MDWAEYQVLCDRPDCWSQHMLTVCIALLAPCDQGPLVAKLRKTLAGTPLPRPRDHRGPKETYMYWLGLTLCDARAMHQSLGRAADELLRAGQDAGLRAHLAACAELVHFLERGKQTYP